MCSISCKVSLAMDSRLEDDPKTDMGAFMRGRFKCILSPSIKSREEIVLAFTGHLLCVTNSQNSHNSPFVPLNVLFVLCRYKEWKPPQARMKWRPDVTQFKKEEPRAGPPCYLIIIQEPRWWSHSALLFLITSVYFEALFFLDWPHLLFCLVLVSK